MEKKKQKTKLLQIISISDLWTLYEHFPNENTVWSFSYKFFSGNAPASGNRSGGLLPKAKSIAQSTESTAEFVATTRPFNVTLANVFSWTLAAVSS